MEFYRYKDVCYANIGVRVQEMKFKLVKETPKGYWITYDWDRDNEYKRWVSKNGRKRYAYPTKEEAMRSFFARKEAQIKILERQLQRATSAISAGRIHFRNKEEDYIPINSFISKYEEHITQEEMTV